MLANKMSATFTDWAWQEDVEVTEAASSVFRAGPRAGAVGAPRCLLFCLVLAYLSPCTAYASCTSPVVCGSRSGCIGAADLISFCFCCASVAEHGHGLFLRTRGRAVPHGELGDERSCSAWRGQYRQPLPLRQGAVEAPPLPFLRYLVPGTVL